MKKDFENFIITLGLIIFVFTQASFAYTRKQTYEAHIVAEQVAYENAQKAELARLEAERQLMLARQEAERQAEIAQAYADAMLAMQNQKTTYVAPVIAPKPIVAQVAPVQVAPPAPKPAPVVKPSRQSRAS